jgi:two-component system, sensor histidine kinase
MAKSTSRPASRPASRSRSRAKAGSPSGSGKRAALRTKSAVKRTPSKAVESALATFAHDVRTPLTGIVAFSELLATSALGEREARWVEAIKDLAAHIAELTTLAVEAARAGKGRLKLRREAFALPRFAARLAFSLAARAEAKGLVCDTSIDELPDEALGDPALLRAAIENLMANAVKFTEQGRVGLAIAATPLARGKLRLSVTVSDSGIGISESEMRRLFRPFAQASAEIAEKFGGAGLGLVQVRRLARAMHGNLKVESKPGRGSAFRFTVTLDRPPTETAPHHADVAPLDILCVEDNPYGRVVMNALLTELGHRTTFAESAEGALGALATGPADVVLMDVALPEVDGYEATRRIRALPGEVSRVAVIGVAGEETDPAAQAAAAAASGMDACLVKPLSQRMLADALARVTGKADAGAAR